MSEHTNDTPWEPPFSGTEAEHLLGALDRLRWTFRWKADGLDAGGLATRLGPSTLTLGGLLKHLAAQEDYAIVVKTDGERDAGRVGGERLGRRQRLGVLLGRRRQSRGLYARYDAAVERARTRLAARLARGGLDQQVALAEKLGQEVSLRRIVCDLVEEYGRHTGQADLIREAVDGRVGEDPPPGWRPGQ